MLGDELEAAWRVPIIVIEICLSLISYLTGYYRPAIMPVNPEQADILLLRVRLGLGGNSCRE